MGNMGVIEDMIEERLLQIRTAYIAKVLSVSGATATVQPLSMVKQYGRPAVKPAVVSNVPVIRSARHKIGGIREGENMTQYLTFEPLKAGDVVFCVCADRDITQTKNGQMAVPPIGHHSISDSVIVGVL
jgi:hypothetical protein